MRGDNMGISVFIVAILCLGVVGVYMYYKAETNSYNTLVEKIQAMQNEIHSNADSIKEMREMFEKQDQANQLITDVTKTTATALSTIDGEIDKLQEHLTRLRESFQAEKSKPLLLDMKWPSQPMVVEVSKLPSRSRFFQTESFIERSKSGVVRKTNGKAIEKNYQKGVHPEIRKSKVMMKAMDL